MMRSLLPSIAFMLSFVLSTSLASAQVPVTAAQRITATVTSKGPIYLSVPPSTTVGPLLIATPGTVLKVIGEKGDWLRVEFNDAQYGARLGWIEKKFVKIDTPALSAATPAVAEKPKPAPPPAASPVQKTAPPPVVEKPKPTPTPAPAPAAPPPQKTASAATKKPSTLAFRGFFSFDMTSLTASQTYDALLGSSTVTALGGGGELDGIWKQLFVRVGVSQASETGERALLIDGEVIPVGIPIGIKMMPIEVIGGWRFTPKGKRRPGTPASVATPHAPYSFYVGGGPVFFKYSETSDFGEPADNLNEMFTGFVFYGGLSADLGRWLFVSGEGGYRLVPNGLGSGGLSAEFGETDLGGAVLRVMVGFRSKK